MEKREFGEDLIGREYFVRMLGEGSQDFVELKKLVEDSCNFITWIHLQQFTRIENGNVEGIYWNENLDLRGTKVKSLWKLKKVNGELDCTGLESLEDLGELENVSYNLILVGTKVKSLGKLNEVGGILECYGLESLEDLGELENVYDYLTLNGTNIRSLGKLKDVWGVLVLKGLSIELQLESMKMINDGTLKLQRGASYGGDIEGLDKLLENEVFEFNLCLTGTSVTSLGKLKKVGGNLDCTGLESLENLGELEEVKGSLDLTGARIDIQLEAIKKIKEGKLKVGNNVTYGGNIEGIEKILEFEEIWGILDLKGTNISSLGKLKKVSVFLDLRGTRLKSLESLKSVGEGLDCSGIESLEDLGDLEEVGGELDLSGTRVKSLGKLKKVSIRLECGGLVSLEDLGMLEEVGRNLNLTGTKIEIQLKVMEMISIGKLRVLRKVHYDDNIDLLNIEEIIKGEVSLFGEIVEMEWIRLFMDKLGEYVENEDEELREIRIFVGKIMTGKYDKSIKEYLEKNKDKLDQDIADSIGKDLNEKLGLFKSLFGERLVGEMFSNNI